MKKLMTVLMVVASLMMFSCSKDNTTIGFYQESLVFELTLPYDIEYIENREILFDFRYYTYPEIMYPDYYDLKTEFKLLVNDVEDNQYFSIYRSGNGKGLSLNGYYNKGDILKVIEILDVKCYNINPYNYNFQINSWYVYESYTYKVK